jgi:hypothetical protein
MKWSVAIVAALVLGCSQPRAPQGPITYQGQRMGTAGQILAAKPGEMVAVGKTDGGREIYVRRGGGGGSAGEQPQYVEVGPKLYQEIVPLPAVGDNMRMER